MSQVAFQASDILGLTPAIDLRRSPKTYALGGKNFAFTSRGPRSVFGNRYLIPYPLGRPEQVQGCRIRLRSGDRSFTFIGDAILEWDETAGGWDIIYQTPITNITPSRWTYGYLNGKLFFCHPRSGIIVYDLDINAVYPHEGPGVPVTPLAICVNNGRLIVMDDTYLSWSWQSDGINFTPALGEAGFQKIADRIAGFPIMLASYSLGVLTLTTGGVLRSEFTGDQEVYRHRNMNTEFHPVNSFCVVQTDENTVVFLDSRGLMSSNGGPPTSYAPMFNEFLIEFLRKNNLTVGQNLRLEWDDQRRFMYVCVSFSPESALYERAFVLYPALDKWGVFNETHYGIVPISIQSNQRAGTYFGFVGEDSLIRFWSDFASKEIAPVGSNLNMRYPLIQKPTSYAVSDSYTIAASSLCFNVEPLSDLPGVGGYYEQDSDTPATPQVEGLDAILQIGLIRFQTQDALDHLSEITTVFIGNIETGPNDILSEDYVTVPDGTDDEDYDSESGGEDFGEEIYTYTNHKLRVISTIDGQSKFQDCIPSLVAFTQAGRYFSCSTSGLWHIIEVSATDPGEAFHVQAMELNAVDAGRLL